MDPNKTQFEKLAFLLGSNPRILAAGWIFTAAVGIITIFAVNIVPGIVIMILLSIFLIAVPKRAHVEKDSGSEQAPPISVSRGDKESPEQDVTASEICEDALEHDRTGQETREEMLGPEDLDTAATCDRMAEAYYARGSYEEALEQYHAALAIREAVLGTEHPDTAETYSNIAEVYLKQRNYMEALKYNEKTLSIREKMWGEEHPSTAEAYERIAVVYVEQNKYDETLEYCRKALAIREKVLGPDHPDTVKTYWMLYIAYSGLRDYGKAFDIYEKIMKVKQETADEGINQEPNE